MTCVTVCLLDLTRDRQVNVSDIFAFLTLWFAGDPKADWDRNGQRDVADIFLFLSNWFSAAGGGASCGP